MELLSDAAIAQSVASAPKVVTVYMGTFGLDDMVQAANLANEEVGKLTVGAGLMTHALQWKSLPSSTTSDRATLLATIPLHHTCSLDVNALQQRIRIAFANRVAAEMQMYVPVRLVRASQPMKRPPSTKKAVPGSMRKTKARHLCIGNKWNLDQKEMILRIAAGPLARHPKVVSGDVTYTGLWKKGEKGYRCRFKVLGTWSSEADWGQFRESVRPAMAHAVFVATGQRVTASQPWSHRRFLSVQDKGKQAVTQATVVPCCITKCTTVSTSLDDAEAHMKADHAVLLEQTDSRGHQLFCPYCGYVGNRYNVLLTHIMRHVRNDHY